MRIAIIGTGIAGLTCAHLLTKSHDVTVFERDRRPGGHTNTVRVELGDETHEVDTGFIVYNERNYPGLVKLFDRLGVPTTPSDMSFGVSDAATGIEWRATSPSTVFAQPRNILRPAFLRMLADVVRFNRQTRRLLGAGLINGLTLRELVALGHWSPQMVDWYLAPMVSAIWSAPIGDALDIPAATFARFFDNHGLLQLGAQPRWRTVTGGARTYVERILAPLAHRVRLATPVTKVVRRADGAEVLTERYGPEHFDHVILAAHSDQSLDLLGDPSPAERAVLGSIRYQPNIAVLHTDKRLLPRARRAWASWNYRLGCVGAPEVGGATLTYHMNQLQSIDSSHQICVTLNQAEAVDPDRVLGVFEYAHPILDGAAVAAQQRYEEISGIRSTWYCGAYWGYGFHEDGVQSAMRVCRAFGAHL
ncbi:MAG: FAD-dependent oxidoreductase [Actinomycetota bacterium]|jgi:predicted NAD/FAD-binding protein|nr:FAD-dependent oxidoreductase [Actinomycetota bacterium]